MKIKQGLSKEKIIKEENIDPYDITEVLNVN